MTYALSNLPSLALPSVKGLSVLLLAYIVLVGPANYLILRWRKRLHWAWVTIPALTLLFSGGAFGLGYALRGTDLIVNRIAIVTAHPSGSARVDSYIGVFSPARQSYEIEVRGDGLLSAVNPEFDPFGQSTDGGAADVQFVQGSPSKVRGLSVNQWSMQTFMSEGTWPELGQISSNLYFEESELVGTVRNGTEQALTDVVIVVGTHYQRLGDLAPGAEAAVRLSLSTEEVQFFGPPISYRLFEEELRTPGPGGPARDVQIKQHVLDSVLNNTMYSPISSMRPVGGGTVQELTLLAWFDSAPPEIQIAGREPAQQTTALLHTPLAYRLPESGSVSVPAGFVNSRILSMPDEGGPCGPPGIPAVYINRGEAVFEFELPAAVRQVDVERLTVTLHTEGGWQQSPDVALYDWQQRAWSDLEDPRVGDNVLLGAQNLVNAEGLVHARISVDRANGGGCYHIGVGFQGDVGGR